MSVERCRFRQRPFFLVLFVWFVGCVCVCVCVYVCVGIWMWVVRVCCCDLSFGFWDRREFFFLTRDLGVGSSSASSVFCV